MNIENHMFVNLDSELNKRFDGAYAEDEKIICPMCYDEVDELINGICKDCRDMEEIEILSGR